MHPKLRWILFIFFVLLFCIGAPTLVLYTAGYRFNFESRTFLRTGVLSVSTAPRSARITLNHETLTEKTPAVLEQLMPGKYTLELTREGYLPWQQQVTIESGKTTLLLNLLLFLSSEPSPLLTQSITALSPSPDGNAFAYTFEGTTGKETWLTHTQGSPTLLERLSASADPHMTWAGDGTTLFFFDASSQTVGVFRADGSPLSLPSLKKETITDVQWAPGSNHTLVLSTAEGTKVADTETQTIASLSSEKIIPIDATQLSFQNMNGFTEIHLQENEKDRILALLPLSSYSVISREGSLLLLQSTEHLLVLLDLQASEPLILKETAPLFSWNTSANLLAFSDGYEVQLYDTKTRTETFLTRQSTPITSLAVHPSGSAILLATDHEIQTMARDIVEDVHPTTSLLISSDPIKTIWVNKNGKTVFLETVGTSVTTISSLALTK